MLLPGSGFGGEGLFGGLRPPSPASQVDAASIWRDQEPKAPGAAPGSQPLDRSGRSRGVAAAA